MSIRWLENGVFLKEAWEQSPYLTEEFLEKQEQARMLLTKAQETTEPQVAPQPVAQKAETSKPVHDPYDLPLPPPNSEVAAQPRADLEHRIRGAFLKDDPLRAIEKSVSLHNQARDLNDYPSNISSLISRDVVTISPEATTKEAVEKLKASNFHHLPVVNADGKLVGLVSDRDLLGRDGVLADRMEQKVLTATPDTQIQEATQALVERKFHSLVVVDHEQRPQGMITSFDLLRYLVEHPAMRLWQSGR